ncbi:MAG TPA: hypothetical protein PLB25_01705 [Rhodoferax sp.]|nr:hypothetical protein [Rhodoferax sp.]
MRTAGITLRALHSTATPNRRLAERGRLHTLHGAGLVLCLAGVVLAGQKLLTDLRTVAEKPVD